ncbi:MAG: SpoIID/LytB domain-containing protein [Acidobacteria bacterium]|nr:MAG: SpoIID/LytB domain-containing protein [Acidobacteriota bacterium]
MTRRRVVALAGALALAGCAPRPEPVVPATLPPPAAPTPAPTAAPAPLPAFPVVPEPLLRVGLASNAASYELPWGDWLLRAGGRVERQRLPATFTASDGTVVLSDERGKRSLPPPVEVAGAAGAPVVLAGAPYRGTLALLVNGRGTLTVVNRVGVEDYLKGVVPAEMGPKVYDEPEALKAQAIAARSYAERHRGESEAEGFDLCATPRCQVYSGIGVESPLSSQAVEETAGEVLLFDGRIADTLFTSTCGGRTEASPDVFTTYASKEHPYLASVPCAGETPDELSTTLPPEKRPTSLLGVRGRALLAAAARTGRAYADLVAARNLLREGLGLPKGGGPRTLQPPAVYADLARAAEWGDLSLLTEETERRLAPEGWPEEARAAYAVALRFQLGGGTALPVARVFQPEEAAGLWAAVLARTGDAEEVEGRLAALEPGKVVLKTARGRRELDLPAALALYAGSGDAWTAVSRLEVRPGDRVRAFLFSERLGGLAAPVPAAAGLYDRESSWSHWTRRATGAELMSRLKERDASRRGTTVTAVEVLERARSGRARVARVTTDGGTFTLSGLEIRFALGIPESLFSVVRGRSEEAGPIFTFYGRGWGHGVGLCQNGAFGMALAGKGYREILAHYYPGTSVGPVPAPPAPPPAPPAR